MIVTALLAAGTLSLSWGPSRQEWSDHIKVELESGKMGDIASAKDWPELCPRFNLLVDSEKMRVIGELIVGMSFYESGWNPTLRFKEPGLGNDKVTGQPLYSEGLLQLSYQDSRWHSQCQFNWAVDRKLDVKDPRKTIFDPKRNLTCGLRILQKQVNRWGKLMVDRGAYWSVIKPKHRNNRIPQIKMRISRAVAGCER